MFCSTCGNELRENLKYCSRCGMRAATELEKIENSNGSKNIAQALTIATGWIGVSGVIALAILIGNLLRRDIIPDGAIALVLIFTTLVFGLLFLMLRQIAYFSGFKTSHYSPIQNQALGVNSKLTPKHTAKLDSARQEFVPMSVIEHTTQTLETNSER